MNEAVFLIVFVAFAARLVKAAFALGNAGLAVSLIALAVAAYLAIPLPPFAGVPLLAVDAAMLGAGFVIPTMLMNAETKSRTVRAGAFLAGLLAAIVAADVAMTTGGRSSFYLQPALWFAAGAACFLIFRARFFEDVLEA